MSSLEERTIAASFWYPTVEHNPLWAETMLWAMQEARARVRVGASCRLTLTRRLLTLALTSRLLTLTRRLLTLSLIHI